jgi:hypothetical protein
MADVPHPIPPFGRVSAARLRVLLGDLPSPCDADLAWWLEVLEALCSSNQLLKIYGLGEMSANRSAISLACTAHLRLVPRGLDRVLPALAQSGHVCLVQPGVELPDSSSPTAAPASGVLGTVAAAVFDAARWATRAVTETAYDAMLTGLVSLSLAPPDMAVARAAASQAPTASASAALQPQSRGGAGGSPDVVCVLLRTLASRAEAVAAAVRLLPPDQHLLLLTHPPALATNEGLAHGAARAVEVVVSLPQLCSIPAASSPLQALVVAASSRDGALPVLTQECSLFLVPHLVQSRLASRVHVPGCGDALYFAPVPPGAPGLASPADCTSVLCLRVTIARLAADAAALEAQSDSALAAACERRSVGDNVAALHLMRRLRG